MTYRPLRDSYKSLAMSGTRPCPPIVFLDYDGVLHPDAAHISKNQVIVLRHDKLPAEYANHTLFGYTNALVAVLAEFPQILIVLSTSWVPVCGFEGAVSRLPEGLQTRVIGSTYHSLFTPAWHEMTRYQQIRTHVGRHRLGSDWLAIDNDDIGWPEELRGNLVLTDDNKGIADPEAL